MLDIAQKTTIARAVLDTRTQHHLSRCQTAALGAVVLALLTGADYHPRLGQLQLYCAPHVWLHLDRYAWIVRMDGDRVVEVVDLAAGDYASLARDAGLPWQRSPLPDVLWDAPDALVSHQVALRYDCHLTLPWLRSFYPLDAQFLGWVLEVTLTYPPLGDLFLGENDENEIKTK